MEDYEIEHVLIEGVMDGIFKLFPGRGYSLTDRGMREAERLIRTSPAAARVYCLAALGEPDDEPRAKERWRDTVTKLWRVMRPRIRAGDAELDALMDCASPDRAAELLKLFVEDSPEFAMDLAGEILSLVRGDEI